VTGRASTQVVFNPGDVSNDVALYEGVSIYMKRLIPLILSAVFVLSFGMVAIAAVQSDSAPDDSCATPAAVASPTDESGGSPDATPVALATPNGSSVATPACATPEGDAVSDVVVVDMVDIAFLPSEITIPADTDVTFQFVNKGSLHHNFKIDDPEVFSGDLSGGASSEVVVNLPAGEYEFYCTIPGHKEAGMVGTLIVE
jgi:uncharacterized cupredoxin-like copper-binding protein